MSVRIVYQDIAAGAEEDALVAAPGAADFTAPAMLPFGGSDAPIAPLCFKRGSLLVRWGMASNLQPTRANPFYRMEEWSIASHP